MARIENSLKSIAVSSVGYLAKIVMQFVSRSVFIYTLGKEYLGFSGLFSNILLLLSLAELGINTGIIYNLYQPVAQDDREKIKSLLDLYRKAYLAVGCFVGTVSLLLAPFLKYLIKDMPDIPHITWIYLFYAANSVLSYFFSYKRSIITATQQQYVISAYSSACLVAMHLSQILILYFTQNYFLYLGLMLFFTLLENLLIARKADRMYPYLREKNIRPLSKAELSSIVDNIRALVFHKVGVVVIYGTDNLLISKLFGLISVGLYSNYTLIINALNAVTGLIYNAIAPSIGNVNATETPAVKAEIFDRIQFFTQWIFGFCTVCLVCLLNPFITLWLGSDFLLPLPIVLVICVNFYLEGMRQPVTISRSAMGLYVYARYKPLVEAVLNLGLSIVFAHYTGIFGIFLGTTVSFIATSFWIEPFVMYRHIFKMSVWQYFRKYFRSTALTGFICVLTYWLCALVSVQGILGFVFQVAICAIVPTLIFVLRYSRSRDFYYFLQLGKNLIQHYSR